MGKPSRKEKLSGDIFEIISCVYIGFGVTCAIGFPIYRAVWVLWVALGFGLPGGVLAFCDIVINGNRLYE